jgi:hypothetical protein
MTNIKHPGLNATGFGDPDFDPIGPEHDEARAAARHYLMAVASLAKRQRRRHDSYGLKHLAEAWWRMCGGGNYIPDGVLIAAAMDLGFNVTPNRHGPSGSVSLPKWGEPWGKEIR